MNAYGRTFMSHKDALELVELLIQEDGWEVRKAFDEYRHQTGMSMASSAYVWTHLKRKFESN